MNFGDDTRDSFRAGLAISRARQLTANLLVRYPRPRRNISLLLIFDQIVIVETHGHLDWKVKDLKFQGGMSKMHHYLIRAA